MRQRHTEPNLAELVRRLRTPRRIDGPHGIFDIDLFEDPDPTDPNVTQLSESEALDRAVFALFGDTDEQALRTYDFGYVRASEWVCQILCVSGREHG